MFPWMMPTMAGSLSLFSLMQPQQGSFGGSSYGFNEDRSDQSRKGNQSDPGNAMAPSGPPGGPDNQPMTGYDRNTVAPAYGFEPSSWMRTFARMGNAFGANDQRSPQRSGMNNPYSTMGLLGLSMMQPRQAPPPQWMPWR